ncbi:hypothetical protein [Clavibacter tessellarius]|uniref:hypothetical protein n=1 Tax=Clavibacter tessellarius TaxID=31965 RepID=UPI00324D9793
MSDRIVVLKDREKIGELSNGPGVTVDTIVELIAAPGDDEDEDAFPLPEAPAPARSAAPTPLAVTGMFPVTDPLRRRNCYR